MGAAESAEGQKPGEAGEAKEGAPGKGDDAALGNRREPAAAAGVWAPGETPAQDEPAPPALSQALSRSRQSVDPSASASMPSNEKSPGPSILRSSTMVDNQMRKQEAQEAQNQDDEVMMRAARTAARVGNSRDAIVVPRDSLVKNLQRRVKLAHDCGNIPFIILYFLVFDLMLMAHENLTNVSQVERQMRDAVAGDGYEAGGDVFETSGHKFLFDVDGDEELMAYLNEALLPNIIPELDGLEANNVHRIYRYNQLIGGVQLLQTRRKKQNCELAYPGLGPFNDLDRNPFLQTFDCYPRESTSSECFGPGAALEGFCPVAGATSGRRLSALGRRLHDVHDAWAGEIIDSMRPVVVDPLQGDVFMLVFHEHEGLAVTLDRLNVLMEEPWIDAQTSWVGVKFLVLNPDLHVYSYITVNFYFLASGQVVPMVRATSFVAEPYEVTSIVMVDVMWLLLLMILAVTCARDFIWSMMVAERRGPYLKSVWTWVDWLSCALGIVAVVCWLETLTKMEAVKNACAEVALNRPEITGGGSDPDVMAVYSSKVRAQAQTLDDYDSFTSFFRIFLSWYNLILMTRFFKAFEAQPRLAIVKNTIVECLPDVIHFGIVFITLLASFSTAAIFLFGHRMAEFSNMAVSMERCLLMLFGYINYNSFAGEHPGTAFIWFFSYIVLMFMVMLNMCLAIIIDVYAGQKAAASVSESIWEQIMHIYRQKKQMKIGKVLEAVENLSTDMVGESTLLEACPEMQKPQAAEILKRIHMMEENEDNMVLTLTDATRVVVQIKASFQKVAAKVNKVVDAAENGKEEMKAMTKKLEHGSGEPLVMLHPNAERRLRNVEDRLKQLEELLTEAMNYSVHRGKVLRDRLKVVEDTLRAKKQQPAEGPRGWFG